MKRRETIRLGAFAGIAARRDETFLLKLAREQIGPLAEPDRTIMVIGSIPGLILDTGARPLALTVFQLTAGIKSTGLEATREFYRERAHRPKVVVAFRRNDGIVVNPMGSHFLKWYSLLGEHKVEAGTLQVFLRTDKGTN